MAKIILNTNLANETFNVSFKSIDVDLNAKLAIDVTDLLITPKNGMVVDAKDFHCASLPSFIKSIKFINSRTLINSLNNVIVEVYFNPVVIRKRVTVALLPISGFATVYDNEFKLIESVIESPLIHTKSKNNFEVTETVSNLSKITSHSIKGVPNSKMLLFSRGFTVQKGYYFPSQPSYNITGDSSRYSVVSTIAKNSNNLIVSKIFNVYYTFPNVEFKTRQSDSIDFMCSATLIVDKISKLINTDKIEKEIYGLDTGARIGSGGGEKRIKITGVPGSTFKLLVQDSDKKLYNFETGVFEIGAQLFLGVIPEALEGVGFGREELIVEIPPSSSGDKVTISLITDQEINHTLLKDQISGTATAETSSVIKLPSKTVEVVEREGSFVFAIKDGGEAGLVIQRPLLAYEKAEAIVELSKVPYVANGSYTIGKAKFGSSIEEYMNETPIKNYDNERISSFAWLITTNADNKFIRVHREALGEFGSAKYLRYDGSSTNERIATSGGDKILLDWGTSVRHSVTNDTVDGESINVETVGIKLHIDVSVKGVGEVVRGVGTDYDPEVYSSVLLEIRVAGNFSDTTISPELNLSNFLSIASL